MNTKHLLCIFATWLLTVAMYAENVTLTLYSNGCSTSNVITCPKGQQLRINAVDTYGYYFTQWSDGNTSNPRLVTVTGDATYIAKFDKTRSGQCGDNLYWSYNNGKLSISGSGAMYEFIRQPWYLFRDSILSLVLSAEMTTISDHVFANCTKLSEVTLGAAITSIGYYAFSECSSLTSITIPNSVKSIGYEAFYNCSGLGDIYSYATLPPTASDDTFSGVSKHCYIHVPAGTIRDYQMAIGWRDFYHFFEISSIPGGGDSTKVSVTVTNNYATFSWPVNPTASSYNLEIKKDGELFCTLVFNTLGQLVGMAFAPSRAEGTSASAAEQTAYGYSFVVSNLESNSHYDFTFITKDSEGQTIESHKGTFQTGTATALEETLSGNDQGGATKFVKDGILYILRDGKIYNAQGLSIGEGDR